MNDTAAGQSPLERPVRPLLQRLRDVERDGMTFAGEAADAIEDLSRQLDQAINDADCAIEHARREVASALDARKFVHAESSRIYARLAAAVRAGADDATLAQLLRDEVNARA